MCLWLSQAKNWFTGLESLQMLSKKLEWVSLSCLHTHTHRPRVQYASSLWTSKFSNLWHFSHTHRDLTLWCVYSTKESLVAKQQQQLSSKKKTEWQTLRKKIYSGNFLEGRKESNVSQRDFQYSVNTSHTVFRILCNISYRSFNRVFSHTQQSYLCV